MFPTCCLLVSSGRCLVHQGRVQGFTSPGSKFSPSVLISILHGLSGLSCESGLEEPCFYYFLLPFRQDVANAAVSLCLESAAGEGQGSVMSDPTRSNQSAGLRCPLPPQGAASLHLVYRWFSSTSRASRRPVWFPFILHWRCRWSCPPNLLWVFNGAAQKRGEGLRRPPRGLFPVQRLMYSVKRAGPFGRGASVCPAPPSFSSSLVCTRRLLVGGTQPPRLLFFTLLSWFVSPRSLELGCQCVWRQCSAGPSLPLSHAPVAPRGWPRLFTPSSALL